MSENEYFLYNSRLNTFLKVDKDSFLKLRQVENEEIKVDALSPDFYEYLVSKKIIVSKTEDDSFINQMRYLKLKRSFMTPSLELIITPTLACNFACPYCYESNLPTKPMNEDIQNQLISFINSHKNRVNSLSINWHGGEPLIAYPSMKSILNKIENYSEIPLKNHRMVTNGYLLSRDKVSLLKKYHINYVQITIDGKKEIHNKIRRHKQGLPTYDVIIENIDYLSTEIPNCLVGIRVNIQKENKDEYPEIYAELMAKWKNRKNCVVYPAIVINQGSCSVSCLSAHEQSQFYVDLYKKYNFDVDFMPSVQVGSCDGIYENSYIVASNGDLFKCWADVGINSRKVGDLKNGITNWEFVSGYMLGSDKFVDSKCLKCHIFPICSGGCNRFRIEQQYNGTPYDVCPTDEKGLHDYLDIIYKKQKNGEYVHCKKSTSTGYYK
ncbi:MAG: radical SAM protein [Dysgonomonas mossii]